MIFQNIPAINAIKAAICAALLLFNKSVCAQNQIIADSLIEIYNKGNLSIDEEFEYLDKIIKGETNPSRQIHFANILLEKAENNENLWYQGIALNQLGNYYKFIGSYDKALTFYQQSLDLAETAKDYQNLTYAYGNLANLYTKIEDHNNALKYFRKALFLATSNKDTNSITSTYYNIADTYYSKSEFDSAKHYLELTKRLTQFVPYGEILDHYILGYVALLKTKNLKWNEAHKDFDKVFKYLEQTQDGYAISDFKWQLSKAYEREGRIEDAISTALESMEYAESYGYRDQIMRTSLKLSELYELSGEPDKSIKYFKQYVTNRDSVQNIQTIQKIADVRSDYEIGQKQAEVDLLTAEKKTQNVILISVAVFACLLVILAVVVYYFYRSKVRVNRLLEEQKLQLESLNQTKDKFFSIISHDLRGPVSSFFGISRMIKYFVESKETDQLLEVADNIDESVGRLSNLLDTLLSWAMQQQGQFPNNPEQIDLKELAQEQVATFANMAESKKINLQSAIEDGTHIQIDKNMMQTILRNLTNNAIKFTGEGGKVTIGATRSNGQVSITVKDTGVGMPQDKLDTLFNLEDKKSTYGTAGEKGLGLGLQLVHEFITLNNGKLRVTSQEQEGTEFEILLPAMNK